MCKICNKEDLRVFKEDHRTLIAVGTAAIIVGIAALLWRIMRKL